MQESVKYDEDAIVQLKRRVGTPITERAPIPYITVATADAIRHWAYGIGDYNPLYIDAQYARHSHHGRLVVPPSLLYAFDKRVTGGVMGMPGIHGLFSGVRWEWQKRAYEGARIEVSEAIVHDVRERTGSFAARELQVTSKITLVDELGDLVAMSYPYSFRMERQEGQQRLPYAERRQPAYTSDELEAIWEEAAAEWRRGSAPFSLDDVAPGENIGTVVRGPLTVSDMIVFLMGWGGQYIRSHGDWVRWLRRHPKGTIRNELGLPDTAEAVHWDAQVARSIGAPGAYDFGPQRVAWAITAVTNWMGDGGFLKCLEFHLRRLVFLGDVVRINGTVTKTEHNAGDPSGAATIEISLTNQHQEVVASGTAIVDLPATSPSGTAGSRP
jgi:acyl dehydratase